MDVQWGTLDDEGERFRGKDAREVISRTVCLEMIDLTCCLRQTFLRLAIAQRDVNKSTREVEYGSKMIHTLIFRGCECSLGSENIYKGRRKGILFEEVQPSAVPKRDKQRHKAAHIEALHKHRL